MFPISFANLFALVSLRDVIDHKRLIEMWPKERDEFFVGWVGKICVAAFLVGEGDEEAVREVVVQAFGCL